MTSIALREDRCKLPSPEAESHGLRQLQMRMVRTSLWQTLTSARLRLCLVIALSMLLLAGIVLPDEGGLPVPEDDDPSANPRPDRPRRLRNVLCRAVG